MLISTYRHCHEPSEHKKKIDTREGFKLFVIKIKNKNKNKFEKKKT
jgi:hypothetical protein